MTDDERAVLVERIARQICFHRGMPACACAGWCRAPVANLLDPMFSTVAQAKAILAAIEPAIRADERAGRDDEDRYIADVVRRLNKAEAEVERLRALLREARAFVAMWHERADLLTRIDAPLAEKEGTK